MGERSVLRLFKSKPAEDGDGVKIKRVAIFGSPPSLDPFLLLDEIASDEAADYIGGFPPHPHRGFETVTYMLEGAMTHKDHMGNVGHLKTGGVQWMTAGKGVIHSEMPEQKEGRLHGFQLWINLPASHKMQAAQYRDIQPDMIPEVDLPGGGKARIIAGSFEGVSGPVGDVATRPVYFDIRLAEDEQLDIPTTETHTVLLYVYRGCLVVDGQTVKSGHLAQLTHDVKVSISARENTGFLFLSAEPIKEPVVNYGPFVMNSREEIEQAMRDYRDGVLTD